MDKKDVIKVLDNHNNEVEGEILFTYESNGDNYVFYAIKESVYAAKIKNHLEEKWDLTPVEEDEWKILEKVYQEWSEENLEKD